MVDLDRMYSILKSSLSQFPIISQLPAARNDVCLVRGDAEVDQGALTT